MGAGALLACTASAPAMTRACSTSGEGVNRRCRLRILARALRRHPASFYLDWRAAGLTRRPHRGHYAARPWAAVRWAATRPQAGYAAKVAGESSRKLVLFSHRQLTSVYDKHDLGPELARKLAPALAGNCGTPMTDEVRQAADGESRRYIWSGLRRWTRFGFAVLDLAGDRINVRYCDDDGNQAYHETIS